MKSSRSPCEGYRRTSKSKIDSGHSSENYHGPRTNRQLREEGFGRQSLADFRYPMDKSRLSAAMAACVDNGQRLLEDAEWLGNDRFATAYALCILAQEEFAKAFLLHLVQEDILPWNSDIRDSMRDHPCKQLLGLLMEWLSPPDDEYFSRIRESAANRDKLMLPPHVAD